MEVKASHILVPSLTEAKKIEAELKAGKDFATLAKKYSRCPSGKNGGDLGFFGPGQMVPEFDQVVFSLKPGTISPPLKTQFGYHLIKVTGRR